MMNTNKIKLLLSSTLLAVTLQASAFDETIKLHIIKNDGMKSHEIYMCKSVRACYDLYQTKWFYDRSLNCASKMWIERGDRVLMRLKS